MLLRAEVLILANAARLVHSECHARILAIDGNLSATIEAFATAHEARYNPVARAPLRSAASGHYLRAWLQKWQLIGQTKYDAVFYSDADVDIFAGAYNTSASLDGAGAAHFARLGTLEAALRAWQSAFPAFLADERAQLLASNDREIVVHGGTFVVKPSQRAYHRGLTALSSGLWTAEGGFEDRGRPRATCSRERVGYGLFKRCTHARFMWDDTWDGARRRDHTSRGRAPLVVPRSPRAWL